MPRLALKPASSFFEKIALGAVGARAVINDLDGRGHKVVELENGSTATKIWKDVKRKRVRIPDLVCINCGLRVESRAKSNKPELAVSHSEGDAERAWDYGLVPSDIVAFPVCSRAEEARWSAGRLRNDRSYWQSRDRIRWTAGRFINYFRVGELREVAHSQSTTKGVTEGSETAISWNAIFCSRSGRIESVVDAKIRVGFDGGGSYTWQNKNGLPPRVGVGATVAQHQLLAATVAPVSEAALSCPGHLPTGYIANLLKSPERTQRFAGIKIARLRQDPSYEEQIAEIGAHSEEDIYVSLEAAAYLVGVCQAPASSMFLPFLSSTNDQIRLEAVVALAAAATPGAVDLLADKLGEGGAPYFLRSAAAWALGHVGTEQAITKLIEAFADSELDVRADALEALGDLKPHPYDQLTTALLKGDESMAAGAAEAMRRYASFPDGQVVPPDALAKLLAEIKTGGDREWIVWLLATLPQDVDYVNAAVAELQTENPRAHFAVSVLWSFLNSWIAPNWELNPNP